MRHNEGMDNKQRELWRRVTTFAGAVIFALVFIQLVRPGQIWDCRGPGAIGAITRGGAGRHPVNLAPKSAGECADDGWDMVWSFAPWIVIGAACFIGGRIFFSPQDSTPPS